MNRKQRIYKLLLKQFNEFELDIVDNSHLHKGHNKFDGNNETHIEIIMQSKSKQKFDRLSIHRKINEIIHDEFNTGLHSIEIKIK